MSDGLTLEKMKVNERLTKLEVTTAEQSKDINHLIGSLDNLAEEMKLTRDEQAKDRRAIIAWLVATLTTVVFASAGLLMSRIGG